MTFEHQNIPKYYQCFAYDTYFYIISEHINYTSTLKEKLKQLLIIPENHAKPIFNQVISVIKYCLKRFSKWMIDINMEKINIIYHDDSKIEIYVRYIYLILLD